MCSEVSDLDISLKFKFKFPKFKISELKECIYVRLVTWICFENLNFNILVHITTMWIQQSKFLGLIKMKVNLPLKLENSS